jgi:hypothetical protein
MAPSLVHPSATTSIPNISINLCKRYVLVLFYENFFLTEKFFFSPGENASRIYLTEFILKNSRKNSKEEFFFLH